MKFLCSHCKAKYQIADERLAGRTLRMTCRSCGQEILLRGDPGLSSNRAPATSTSGSMQAVLPSVPSALGAEFQSALAGSLHPLPPAVPIDEWHVAIDDAPVGPMRREEVARRLASGVLGPESLAWREGLDDWMAIRAIPELAVLCAPSQMAPAIGLAPAPIGGRGGAAPAYTLDDWGPLPDRSGSLASGALVSGSMHDQSSPGMATPRGPSMPMMFAVACGFAFLMSALTILGARWLREETSAPTADATPSAQPAPAAAPVAPAAEDEGPEAEMTIELEETGVNTKTGKNKGGVATTGGKPKKELTAAQKAMLERMGGSAASDLGALQRKDQPPAAGGNRKEGQLGADQLRPVVQRGQKNLQRCYESALRGAGADSTIRLDVHLTVSPNGNATNVQVKGQGLPGMNECISRTIKMWRFPNATESSELAFPLLFQPGG
jgi:DNA-directed RNA polymerase subunit RPC12/RpoP